MSSLESVFTMSLYPHSSATADHACYCWLTRIYSLLISLVNTTLLTLDRRSEFSARNLPASDYIFIYIPVPR